MRGTIRTAGAWALATALAALMIIGLTPTIAHADPDPDDDSITRYDVTATLAEDGSMTVEVDLDLDFGADEGRGPIVALSERQAVEGDDSVWRSTPISDVEVSSGSGANVEVQRERENGLLVLQVGNEDEFFTGTQNYRISYAIDGVGNPNATGSGLDELSWNAVGNGWELPLNDVSVTVEVPGPIERTACFVGETYSTACSSEPTVAGQRVTVTADRLPAENGLQVVAGMPAGTFQGAEPIFTRRNSPANVLGLDSPVAPIGAGVVAIVGLLGAGALLRNRRDRHYAGITPGEIPAPGQPVTERAGAPSGTTAVRFTPPDQGTPGQIGVLTDATADNRDVTASLIDLAVRGHLVIEQTDNPDTGDKLDWTLHRRPDATGELRTSERQLLQNIFSRGNDVTLAELGKGTMATAVSRCHTDLYDEVTGELGWYRGKPSTVRGLWMAAGAGLFVLGFAGFAILGFTVGFGLIGLAVALVGIIVGVMGIWAPSRTALGSAVHAQAMGFKQYLATAEAGQIRFEEGEDIFSRYLPYAIVWKLTDRWAKVFEQLAAQGYDLPVPHWYVGTNVYLFSTSGGVGSFASSIEGFTSAAATSMTAATSSSGGGSGFSGGGGVGGGGGGSW